MTTWEEFEKRYLPQLREKVQILRSTYPTQDEVVDAIVDCVAVDAFLIATDDKFRAAWD